MNFFLYGSGVSFYPNYAYIRYAYLSVQPPAHLSIYPFADVSPFRIRPAHAVPPIPFATGLIVFSRCTFRYLTQQNNALTAPGLPGMPEIHCPHWPITGYFSAAAAVPLETFAVILIPDIQHLYSDVARQQILWLLPAVQVIWDFGSSSIMLPVFYLFRLTDKTELNFAVVSIAGVAFINTLLLCAAATALRLWD